LPDLEDRPLSPKNEARKIRMSMDNIHPGREEIYGKKYDIPSQKL
jgi:hypothetical protein